LGLSGARQSNGKLSAFVTPENRPEVLFEKLFGNEDNNTLAGAKQATILGIAGIAVIVASVPVALYVDRKKKKKSGQRSKHQTEFDRQIRSVPIRQSPVLAGWRLCGTHHPVG